MTFLPMNMGKMPLPHWKDSSVAQHKAVEFQTVDPGGRMPPLPWDPKGPAASSRRSRTIYFRVIREFRSGKWFEVFPAKNLKNLPVFSDGYGIYVPPGPSGTFPPPPGRSSMKWGMA